MDITKLSIAELWKLAFGEQEVITNALAQIQQAQANVKAIKDEIAKREESNKPQPDEKQ